MSPSTVVVRLGEQSLVPLARGGFRLYVYKAVRSSLTGGFPVPWASTGQYSTNTSIEWTEQQYAYATTAPPGSGPPPPGGVDAKPVRAGQTLDVGPNAVTSVDPSQGYAGTIAVRNTTTTPFTCGLAQSVSLASGIAPVCAFPLYGKHIDLITPLPAVALLFATLPVPLPTHTAAALGPAVLIDPAQTPVELAYDINKGWTWTAPGIRDLSPADFATALIRPL